jgi:hypothetical protein
MESSSQCGGLCFLLVGIAKPTKKASRLGNVGTETKYWRVICFFKVQND